MSFEDFTILTKNHFDEYVKNNDSIVIFHKKLCPHCKIMGTVLDKVKAKMPSLNLASVDSEDEPDLMRQCGVERIPTLIVYKQGALKARFTGIMNPAQTQAFFQNA